MLSRLWRSLKPRYNSHSQHMVHVSDKIVIYEKFCALPILAGICGLFVYFWLHSPRQSSVNKPCPQRAENKQNQPITVTQIGQVCHQSSLCWNKSSVSIQTRLQYKWGQFKIYKLLLPTVRKKGKCKLETGARKFFLPEIGSIKTVYGRILFWWSYQAEVSHFTSLSAYQNVMSRELTVDSWQSISVSKFPTVLYSPAPVGAKNAEQSHYQVV